MNSLKFFDAMGQIDDDIIMEVASHMDKARTGKTFRRKKIIRTLLIAAALVSLFSVSAYAVGRYINSPEQAWQLTQTELATWKEMGILSPQVTLDTEADILMELPEQEGDSYWFGRIWKHRYAVGSANGKYNINLFVDTASGKITKFSIEANADDSDVPVRTETAPDGSTYNFYDNYDDIFSPDMTVDRICTLLAEYWGFSGYTLSGTEDEFYGYDTAAPSGDTLLTELDEEAYLTIYFDGDQSGVPMYVQLAQNAGQVYMTVGTNHLVG